MDKKANDAFHELSLLVEIKVVFSANLHEIVNAYNHHRDNECMSRQPNYVQRAPSVDEEKSLLSYQLLCQGWIEWYLVISTDDISIITCSETYRPTNRTAPDASMPGYPSDSVLPRLPPA